MFKRIKNILELSNYHISKDGKVPKLVDERKPKAQLAQIVEITSPKGFFENAETDK